MITDAMLIQMYNEEISPSVKSMISDLNIDASQRTTMVATPESENPPNKNTIELFNLSNENTTAFVVRTRKDATLLEDNREPRSNKRPTNDDRDINGPGNKRSKNDKHASMMLGTTAFGPRIQINITISITTR
jgi:hypothetical protein